MKVSFQILWKRILPPGHTHFSKLLLYEALLAMKRGEREAAIARADRAITMTEASPERLTYLPGNLLRRAEMNLNFQRFTEAQADAERILTMEQTATSLYTYSSRVGAAYLMLARALDAQGKIDEARAAAASAPNTWNRPLVRIIPRANWRERSPVLQFRAHPPRATHGGVI